VIRSWLAWNVFKLSDMLSPKLVKNATLKIQPDGRHGLADTHKDQLNTDRLAFLMA
jgi:non-heme chloroperoxidase